MKSELTVVNTECPGVPQYDGFACRSTVHDLLSCFMSFAICFSLLLFFFPSLVLPCFICLSSFLSYCPVSLLLGVKRWAGLVHSYLISLFLSLSVTQWLDLDSLVSQFRVERSNFFRWKSTCRNRKRFLKLCVLVLSLSQFF